MSSISSALDAAYHSKIYQDTTTEGPFAMPNSIADHAAEGMVSTVKKIAGSLTSPEESKGPNPQPSIDNFPVPTARNWTRAYNGILQGIAVLSIPLLFRLNFLTTPGKCLLNLGALSWSAVGAHHLAKTPYTDEQLRDYSRNARFVWEK